MSFLMLIVASQPVLAQEEAAEDTLSRFERFNEKALDFFVWAPFPIFSYSQETGQVFGLVKYNLIDLVEKDTISAPSSFSALTSLSSLGQFKVVLGSTAYLKENKIVIKAEANYIKFPQYALGVGNNVEFNSLEEIESESYNFNNAVLFAVDDETTIYFGAKQQLSYYSNIELEDSSFYLMSQYPGYEGGITSGIGPAFILDRRDHRYNTTEGYYVGANAQFNGSYLGSDFNFQRYELDCRYFIKPWFEHVIGFQAYTQANYGTVPFYELAFMGGSERMRGYYEGAIRDKVIADCQVEYRMPVFGPLGMVFFAGAGRVANDYRDMAIDGVYKSAGLGLRLMVDPDNRANLRFDYGFGQNINHIDSNDGTVKSYRTHAFVVGFTESF